MSGSGLTFLLSYARDDRKSGPPLGIPKFFKDLSSVLRPLAELDSPFHDRDTGYRTADPAAPPGRCWS